MTKTITINVNCYGILRTIEAPIYGAISFAQTLPELMCEDKLRRKKQTRREWKDSYAQGFINALDRAKEAGYPYLAVRALDKSYRNGGKQIGWALVQSAPLKQTIAKMDRGHLFNEGGICQTVQEFADRYFGGNLDLEVWVINFEFISFEEMLSEQEATQTPKTFSELRAIENTPKAKSQNLKTLTSSKSDEHNTPAHIIHLARKVFGEIDLDPMSNKVANRTVGAAKFFTKEQDGLQQNWEGKIWLNPPFSLADRAVAKLIHWHESGHNEALLLLKSAPDTKRHQSLFPYPFCDINYRIKFDAPGNKTSAPFPVVIFYLGRNFTKFREIFGDVGRVHLGEKLTKQLEMEFGHLLARNAQLEAKIAASRDYR